VGHKPEVRRACRGAAFRRPSSAVACYGGWKDGILNQNPIFEMGYSTGGKWNLEGNKSEH
jgi:hypothetical protein